ncbi:hypothetical protein SAFG77S_03225 [Streptomyces afghaniensis]
MYDREKTCPVEGTMIVQRRAVPTVLAAAALLLTAGCSSDGGGSSGTDGSASPSRSAPGSSAPAGQAAEETPPAEGSVKVVRTVAEGLDSPWGLAPLPGGGLLVSSRDDGTIVRVDEKTGKKTELGEVPGVSAAGEGGLLGIALSPEYASDHMVYAYFTSASDNRIVRMLYDEKKPSGEQLGAPDTVFRGIPKGFIHNGGRIEFGPDKMLYVGTGESGDTGLSQDKDSVGGKILRLTPEGEPAPGNPFGDSPVYSYGHRNVQGLAWDAKQRLFASEFGQDTWDELNAIKPGDNYGWPEAEGTSGDSGFHNPVRPVDHGRGLAQRHRLRRGFGLDGGPARQAAVAHPAERHRGLGRTAGVPRGRVRPAAHGGPGGRRPAVAGDQQHGRPGQPEGRGRPDPRTAGELVRDPSSGSVL